MKMIQEYPLGIEDLAHDIVNILSMPKGAKILDIQVQDTTQGQKPFIWAIVNPNKERREYIFHVFGTGYPVDDYEKKHYEYIKTVQVKGLVDKTYHIFLVHE